MNREQAMTMGRQLMAQHLGANSPWRFRIMDTRGRRKLGCCCYNVLTIILTGWYVDHNDEAAVRDTILHEIAHALAGSKAGHGPAWKAMAEKIGAQPNRLTRSDTINRPTGAYKAVCPACAQAYYRNSMPRMGRRHFCRCKPIGERQELTWQYSKPTIILSAKNAAAQGVKEVEVDRQWMGPRVDQLLKELPGADRSTARKIRSALRRLGHRGGLNG